MLLSFYYILCDKTNDSTVYNAFKMHLTLGLKTNCLGSL